MKQNNTNEKTGSHPVFSVSEQIRGNGFHETTLALTVSDQNGPLDRDVCRYSDTLTFYAALPRTLEPADGRLRVFCDDTGDVLWFDAEPLPTAGTYGTEVFAVRIEAKALCAKGENSALLYYRFECETRDGHCILAKTPSGLTPVLRFEDSDIHAFQLLIQEDHADAPRAIRGGIMYHIFVDRFYPGDDVLAGNRVMPVKDNVLKNDDWYHGVPQHAKMPGGQVENNEFFGGTLWGVKDKLPYLASLGVDILYLSPIFEAYSNHKYDTGDYSRVDPMFGGDEALKALLDAAKEHGIRVICDGVFNHTGDDSVYFNRYGTYPGVGAYQSEKSPYYPWYRFKVWPDDYESWWGVKVLPGVYSGNTDFRNYICGEGGILQKWMNMGVYGWRLDVADELDERFLCDLRIRVKKENPEAMIYGEVWEDASNKIAYDHRRRYFRGRQLDSVMNYPFREGIISYIKDGDAGELARTVETITRHYPEGSTATLMNLVGTHDTERILTALAAEPAGDRDNDEIADVTMTEEERRKGRTLVKLAALLQFTLPGIPCVYYGDEAGMEGYRDPFNRRPYPWGKEDTELLSWYRKLGALRQTFRPCFADGAYRLLTAKDGACAFRRGSGQDAVIICVNRGRKACRLPGAWLDHLTGDKFPDGITLSPDHGAWLTAL